MNLVVLDCQTDEPNIDRWCTTVSRAREGKSASQKVQLIICMFVLIPILLYASRTTWIWLLKSQFPLSHSLRHRSGYKIQTTKLPRFTTERGKWQCRTHNNHLPYEHTAVPYVPVIMFPHARAISFLYRLVEGTCHKSCRSEVCLRLRHSSISTL
jgi:hypothetical protein